MFINPLPESLGQIDIRGQVYHYVDLPKIVGGECLQKLPYSIRLLLENVARCAPEAFDGVLARACFNGGDCEVPFYPNRLMFHDTTCLPALVDFAGMRDAVQALGGTPQDVNPVIPAVLTIDHSVIVEKYASPEAAEQNLDIDFRRNAERYRFIKWAEKSLDNFKVIPPGTGIIHQMNMEVVAQVVCEAELADGRKLLHPDDMVATDSHTPMINAIGVLAWGVGGLEGQAALVGEPVPIPYPEVIGIRLTNSLAGGVAASDLALRVAEILRARKVVGKFVEFFGPGLSGLGWGVRGTVSNMAPEYGATVVFFPFDDETHRYLHLSGRSEEHIEKVDRCLQAQALWRRDDAPEPEFDEIIELDLASIKRSMAGPFQPHQRQDLSTVGPSFNKQVAAFARREGRGPLELQWPRSSDSLDNGAVVIAAITSCTNTSNPQSMIQAGLLARNARRHGLLPKPWVKTSLSPGSQVVADYLRASGLMADFSAVGFDLTGFGCMTCIGNSGRLESHVEKLADKGFKGVAVLSGNRNFAGRVNPKVPAGYLASPALVVAYALAGTVDINIEADPIAQDALGKDIYLHDLMPSDEQVGSTVNTYLRKEDFRARARTVWDGTPHWAALDAAASTQFEWDSHSTYLRRPQYLEAVARQPGASGSLRGARVLMHLGDNVTTDHISPAGAIPAASLAGQWLLERGEDPADLNQYSTRRSNHEVMLRGAYTNQAVNNKVAGTGNAGSGGWAWNASRSQVLPVYEASRSYLEQNIPLVIIGGINYGAGSSRDWAAKAQSLLGVRAVIAQSFERIHRSNLIGMGVYPIEFMADFDSASLVLQGDEILDFDGLGVLHPGVNELVLTISRAGQTLRSLPLVLRIDSDQEIRYLDHGGVLPFVIRKMLARSDGRQLAQTAATPATH
ncbi:aconitate hydratase AcnA [Paralcaligenes ginsengisoli]